MADLNATGGVPGPGQIGRVAIGDILRRSARRFPNRVALTDGDRSIAYAELDREANRVANALIARGVKPGAKVSTICNNSIPFVAANMGIHRAGLVWTPINTMLAPDDMGFILDHAEVGTVLIDDNLWAQPERRAALEARGLDVIAVDLTGAAKATGLPVLQELMQGQSDEEPEVEIDERDLAMIIYTSGTTSRPKGAMHCHLSVVMSAMSNVAEMKYDRASGVSGQLPLFHCAAHTLLTGVLAAGGKMALMRGFDPVACMEAVERDRLTAFVGIPMMYQAIVAHPRRREFDLSSLKTCIYAMAPMPRPLIERCIAELCPNFVLASGQTEMYPATTMSMPDRQLLRFGNYWGESLMVNESAIMDDEGRLLPPGEIGELVHRGPNVMLGYYKDPKATEESRRFGWHHTGDLAMIDAHGEILFVDRKKDMIKSGGENVASVKIEETLMAHPAVMSAAVVGLPHPQWGEAVSAFVTLKPGAEAQEAEIVAFAAERLGGFQVPKLVRILPAIPMTATGKLRKTELRQRYMDLFATQRAEA